MKKTRGCVVIDTVPCVAFCCGGPTRTGDLQVMSLASYQLLHSAIILTGLPVVCGCKGTPFLWIGQIIMRKSH